MNFQIYCIHRHNFCNLRTEKNVPQHFLFIWWDTTVVFDRILKIFFRYCKSDQLDGVPSSYSVKRPSVRCNDRNLGRTQRRLRSEKPPKEEMARGSHFLLHDFAYIILELLEH